MCLSVLGYGISERYPFIAIHNRDEYYSRAFEPAQFWPEHPHLLAGRDLSAGGTWLGISKLGHFGLITNVRNPKLFDAGRRSRGHIILEYLTQNSPSPEIFFSSLVPELSLYNPFNLLFGPVWTPHYMNSIDRKLESLPRGCYGLSNSRLDAEWYKVRTAKLRFQEIIANTSASLEQTTESLFTLLGDATPARDTELPETGVGKEVERMLSSIFVQSETYGTVSSSVILIDTNNRALFLEHNYRPGCPKKMRHHTFEIEKG